MTALRCVDVPGYSVRVVRVFDGPGPVPVATLSVTPEGDVLFHEATPREVVEAVVIHVVDHPHPGE